MTRGISIEPAGAHDLEALVPLVARFYEEAEYPFDPSRMRSALAALLSDPARGGVWMMTDQTRPVGYCVLTLGYSLEYQGRDAFVDEVYVLPEYRGKGFGKSAFAVLTKAARRLEVNALHLEVERGNDAALALYRKMGFEESERFLMTKKLDVTAGRRGASSVGGWKSEKD